MIEREIYQKLVSWKNQKYRRPLVLKGARQTGKSFIITEFGQQEFKKIHCVNFQRDKFIHPLFQEQQSLRPQNILRELGYLLKDQIDIQHDLLFFDEIQDCAGAINSLKYFEEELPQMAVIATGSYLGTMVNQESFPVGKVEFTSMGPLCFREFLLAISPKLIQHYDNFSLDNPKPIEKIYHDQFLKVLKLYFTLGGMPRVVQRFIDFRKDNDESVALQKVVEIQESLLLGHKADFSKYYGAVNPAHINYVFDAVSLQLSKAYDDGVKKFKFSGVIPKQKGYERVAGPLNWLLYARLTIKCLLAKKAVHPLKSYCEMNRFKLFMFDVGLLHRALDIPIEVIMASKLGSYKGYLAENFVACEFFNKTNNDLYSWAEGNSEIEFLIQRGVDIIPVEVKSSSRSRRAKSLDVFIEKYHPPLAIKLTSQNVGYMESKNLLTLPIYLAAKLF